MSITNYFCDWKVDAVVQTKKQVPNDTTGHMDDSYANGATLSGVLHTTTTNERYFNIEWASDVVKVFKTDVITGLTEDSFLYVGSIRYSVDGINNVNEQGLVYVVGLKVKI